MRVLYFASMLPTTFEKLSAPWNIGRMASIQMWENAEVKAVCPVRLTPPEAMVFRFPPDFKAVKQWHDTRKNSPDHMQYGDFDITYLKWYGPPKRFFWGVEGRIMYRQLRKSLTEIVKEFKPDVIHVPWLNPEGVAGCLLGHEFNIPCVVQSIGADINYYLRRSPGRSIVIKDLQKAAALIYVCDALRQNAIRYGLTHKNQQVVYDGVDIEFFKPAPELRSKDKKTIVTVADMIPRKNLGLLLNAFARVVADFPTPLELVLVGDGPCKPELEQQARDLNINSKVFFTGHVPHASIAVHFQKADLFCLTSLSEGLPVVAIEAMACGLPVVATNVDGVPEAVVEGVTGSLVESENLDAFTDALRAALSRNWDYNVIREVVLSRFTWKCYAESIMALYRDVCDGNSLP